MDSRLRAYLGGRAPFARETAAWGELDLEIAYFSADSLPPDHLVTSVRAVVADHERVLVVREPTGAEHVTPGGRRRPGESPEDTVRREVLEETRWRVGDLSVLAVVHFHIRSPVPDDYPYPSPDFLQVIYGAEPLELQADREIEDEWVDACLTVPLTAARGHDLTEPQRLLLAHALGGTGPLMAREVDGRR